MPARRGETTVATTNPSEESGEFRRVLGLVDASALVAGSMIGTGIFVFVSDVARTLPPSPALVMGMWALGALVAACGALCLGELAAADPRTGGIYVYLVDAFGSRVGFLYGWCKFAIMRVASFAIPALLFAGFAAELAGLEPARVEALRVPLAVLTVVGLTVINATGVRSGSALQVTLTAIKLLALVALLVVGASVAAGWIDPVAVALPSREPFDGSLATGLGTAMVAVMWTYGGWDESPFVGEEVRDPARTLPRSVVGGLVVVAGLFVLANAVYLSLLGVDGLAASGQRTASFAMERALGPGARTGMTVVLLISTIGVANGMALTGARIAFAAGRDQRAFRWFAATHPRTRTPVRALVVQAGLAIAAIVALENPFELLLLTGLAYWLFAGAMALAVIVLRRRDPGRPRPFRAPAYPLPPVAFAAAAAGMCGSVLADSPRNAAATLAILAAGAVVHHLTQRDGARSARPC